MWVRFVNLDQLATGAVIAALPTIVVYLALRGLLAGSSQGIREYYSVLVSPLRSEQSGGPAWLPELFLESKRHDAT